MRPTPAMISLTTGAALASSLRAAQEALAGGPVRDGQDARTGADKVKGERPPLLDEDLRIVGALGELFATAAAERLMNAGLTPGSDEQIYRRPSSQSRRNVMPQVLPLIALAAGVALCSPVVASPAVAQRDRAATRRRHRSRPDQRRIRRPSAA